MTDRTAMEMALALADAPTKEGLEHLADHINGQLYDALDAASELARLVQYHRLNVALRMVLDEVDSLHSALTDIAEGEREDVA